MNQIRYWYNQNRKQIWAILIIIASVIIVIQVTNFFVKQNSEKAMEQAKNTTPQTTNYNTSTSTLTSNKSGTSGETLSDVQLKTATETINQFVVYCNNKDTEKAYNMLTNECKEQIYDSQELFEQTYYDDNFGGESRTAEIENWSGSIYKVRITPNILATGKSNNGYAKEDYITVKRIDDTYKLNINNYIGYTEINKTTENDNIKMEVVGKNTYKDKEEYVIKVTNKTDYTMMLDTLNEPETMYLEGENGTKHSAYSHELTDAMLTVTKKETTEVKISFFSYYSSKKKTKYVVFSDIRFNAPESGVYQFKAQV